MHEQERERFFARIRKIHRGSDSGRGVVRRGFAAGMQWQKGQQPTLSPSTIETQISDCSDLATSKLAYNGLVKYEAGTFPD